MNPHPAPTPPPQDTRDTTPGQHGGIVRTPIEAGESQDCGPFLTSTDTARTRARTGAPDGPVGVRVAYAARVPRHLAGAAIAEGLAHVLHETTTPDSQDNTPVRTPDTAVRRDQARSAIAAAFDIPTSLSMSGQDTSSRPDHPRAHPDVAGHCPACSRTSLYLAPSGHVTCAHINCPTPDAASTLLDRAAT
ncbi:hypothetical protein [Streptomyces bacillaris]|uniref:hypothetical protein n=1 Tax=Streptomyces bacillaris TaxID=68179 RepID=UPI0036428864